MKIHLFLTVAIVLVAHVANADWPQFNSIEAERSSSAARPADWIMPASFEMRPILLASRLPAPSGVVQVAPQPILNRTPVPVAGPPVPVVPMPIDVTPERKPVQSFAPHPDEMSYMPQKCEAGCIAVCSCLPPWAHRTSIFAEALYWRVRDAEVAYAVPIDGGIFPPPAAPVQVGPVALTDPDYEPAFRVGGSFCLDECTSLVGTYTHFEAETQDAVSVSAPVALRSLVLHPGNVAANSDFLDATAALDIDLDMVDADFRSVWFAGDCWAVNYIAGARYAHLAQEFRAIFTNAGTTDTLLSDVDFDGAGLRFGIDGERHTSHHGFLMYGSAVASLLAGEFRSRYFWGNTADPTIVDTSWRAGRLVPTLDIELGAGWQSHTGKFRFTVGYETSMWFNSITTDEWIQSVRNNNFVNISDTMTMDGLTGRAEYRF